jgi:hypothetical protein
MFPHFFNSSVLNYAKLKTQKPHPFYAGECDGGPWKTCENTHSNDLMTLQQFLKNLPFLKKNQQWL